MYVSARCHVDQVAVPPLVSAKTPWPMETSSTSCAPARVKEGAGEYRKVGGEADDKEGRERSKTDKTSRHAAACSHPRRRRTS